MHWMVGGVALAGTLVVVASVSARSATAQASVPGPVAPAWESLSPEEQAQAREHYQRFQGLPDGDREQVEVWYQRWLALSPEQREQVRRNYESYRGLDPDERLRFERSYEDWKTQARPANGG